LLIRRYDDWAIGLTEAADDASGLRLRILIIGQARSTQYGQIPPLISGLPPPGYRDGHCRMMPLLDDTYTSFPMQAMRFCRY